MIAKTTNTATVANANDTNTAAIALAFTAQEESSALNSTVAWTVHIVADVLGWNGKPRKGGKAVAIKAARESYGYRVDSAGKPILDAKGNRAKRSAVFSRLALVDKLITYVLANEKTWLDTIHASAINPESDAETRESTVASEIELFAARLATVAKGETIDALKHYLETGKAKADSTPEPVADASAALEDSGETSKDKTPEAFNPESIVAKLDKAQLHALAKAVATRLDAMARETEKASAKASAKAA